MSKGDGRRVGSSVETQTPTPLRWARARVAFAILWVYLGLAVSCKALLAARLFDDRKLDEDLLELAWQLQLPWRASHGQWAGRDFQYTLGPLFQLLAWVGSGFGLRSPGVATAGYVLVFGAVSLGTSAWLTFRIVERPWHRLACFAGLALMVLGSEPAAVRALTLLLVIILYAPRSASDALTKPSIKGAIAPAVALTAATLFSYDRGVMGLVAVTAMVAYETVGRRLLDGRAPMALRRYGLFLAALVACQLVLAAVAAALGIDYLGYLAAQARLAASFTLGMAGEAVPGSLEGPVGLFLCASVLAALFALRRFADVTAGMWLVGAVPSLVTALVRTDATHVWLAMLPLGFLLILVAARQIEQRRIGTAFASGVLAAILALAWFGTHPEGLRASSPEVFFHVAELAAGEDSRDVHYESDITRVRQFVRDRVEQEGIRCVGLYQGADVVHALVDVPGPTETMLRWSSGLQAELAERIEAERCPYYVQRLFSYDHAAAAAWNIGDDFVRIARLYEPYEQLGPDVWAMRLRRRATHETVRTVHVAHLGERRRLPVPSSIEIPLDPPIPPTHLLRLAYTLEVNGLRRWVGGVPQLYVDYYAAGERRPFSTLWLPLGAINERTQGITAVHAEAAERRWMTGREPRALHDADRMVIRVVAESSTNPSEVGLTIHSIEDLAPGDAPRTDAGTCTTELDLVGQVRAHHALARAPSILFDDTRMYVHPNRPLYAQAEIFVPARPCPDACLEGRFRFDGPHGDGVRFEAHVIDQEVRTQVIDQTMVPGDRPIDLERALAPWGDRDVLVRLGVEPRATSDYDWAWVDRLRIAPCHAVALARFVAQGAGGAVDARPDIGGADIYLHPNAPGAPAAEVVVAVQPGSTSCLVSGLRVSSALGQGDGVVFTAEVLSGSDREVLFSQLVLAGTGVHSARAPLAPWADQPVRIRLSTLPGRTTDYDWASFLSPRVQACADPDAATVGLRRR